MYNTGVTNRAIRVLDTSPPMITHASGEYSRLRFRRLWPAINAQTLRYRMTRLRELLGDALDDPELRYELEFALRAARS